MNQTAQMQALHLILESIRVGTLDRVGPRILADLAACAQAILYAPSDEQAVAWVEAQRLIAIVAEVRAAVFMMEGCNAEG